jgi:hypothetical protein
LGFRNVDALKDEVCCSNVDTKLEEVERPEVEGHIYLAEYFTLVVAQQIAPLGRSALQFVKVYRPEQGLAIVALVALAP